MRSSSGGGCSTQLDGVPAQLRGHVAHPVLEPGQLVGPRDRTVADRRTRAPAGSRGTRPSAMRSGRSPWVTVTRRVETSGRRAPGRPPDPAVLGGARLDEVRVQGVRELARHGGARREQGLRDRLPAEDAVEAARLADDPEAIGRSTRLELERVRAVHRARGGSPARALRRRRAAGSSSSEASEVTGTMASTRAAVRCLSRRGACETIRSESHAGARSKGVPPMLSGEKILITGPAGRIAFGLARSLAADNEVWGIARFGDPATREKVEALGVTTRTRRHRERRLRRPAHRLHLPAPPRRRLQRRTTTTRRCG